MSYFYVINWMIILLVINGPSQTKLYFAVEAKRLMFDMGYKIIYH